MQEEMQFDWQVIADKTPQGYLQMYPAEGRLIHAPVESLTINQGDNVVITTSWQAEVPVNSLGMPTSRWARRSTNDPITFPNLVIPFTIQETPEKGPRVFFTTQYGPGFIYLEGASLVVCTITEESLL